MSRVYVVARVPTAAREACESLIAPYLQSPNSTGVYTFSVPLAPLPGPTDAAPTAYGACSAITADGDLATAIPALAAAILGVAYRLVVIDAFDLKTDWLDWLAAGGLQPRREVIA